MHFELRTRDYRPSKRRALKFSQVRRPGWRPIFATKRTVQLGSLMSITCISLREGSGLGGGSSAPNPSGQSSSADAPLPVGRMLFGRTLRGSPRLKGGVLDETETLSLQGPRGIGATTAEALAAEGCNVMLGGFGEMAAIEAEREHLAESRHSVANPADLSEEADCDSS